MQYNFKWDPNKARTNLKKRGISFEMAANVFKDPLMLTLFDEPHSEDDEERWITLGKKSISPSVWWFLILIWMKRMILSLFGSYLPDQQLRQKPSSTKSIKL